VAAGGGAEGRGVAARAGGGLGMDEGQDFGRTLGEDGLHLGRIDRHAPGVLDDDHLGPGAAGHVGEAAAEGAVRRDDRAVAGLEQVHHRRLHARRARRGQRDAGVARRVHQPGEAGLDLLHQVLEGRIEVADGRSRKRGEHARADVGGAGAQENPPGRLEAVHHPSV
jgi:hypothetical protein